MALPDPKPGMVLRYDYLWTHDAAAGRNQGKDRPACLVAASNATATPRFVLLLPITHTPPSGDTVGIEIPERVGQALGLDDARSWVIVSEHNVDEWPSAGVQPLPGGRGVFSYGFVPPSFFAEIRSRFISLAERGRSARVRRE